MGSRRRCAWAGYGEGASADMSCAQFPLSMLRTTVSSRARCELGLSIQLHEAGSGFVESMFSGGRYGVGIGTTCQLIAVSSQTPLLSLETLRP